MRSIVVEMRSEASAVQRRFVVLVPLILVGLVLVGVFEPVVLILLVFPWSLPLVGAAFGPLLLPAQHARELLPQQIANLRPLPPRWPRETTAVTERSATVPRRLWVQALVCSILGTVVAGGGLAAGEEAHLGAGLLAVFLLAGAGLTVIHAVGSALALERISDRWEDWQAGYGVVVLRDPVPLPQGFVYPEGGVLTLVGRRAPAQLGVGWYWVPAAEVPPGAVG